MAMSLNAGAAWAQTSPNGNPVVPCTNLPAAAVKAIPAPFDRYMQFVCYRAAGQGLRAVDGYHWAAQQGFGIDLSSSQPGPPAADGSRRFPLSWYTKLQPVDLSASDQERLRSDFLKGFRDEVLKDVQILELRATTSNAEEKRIFLVLPKGKLDRPPWLLGLECNGSCFHDDPEPMLFSGEPN